MGTTGQDPKTWDKEIEGQNQNDEQHMAKKCRRQEKMAKHGSFNYILFLIQIIF